MTISEAWSIINTEIKYKNSYFKIREDVSTGMIVIVAFLPVKDACSGDSYELAPIMPVMSADHYEYRFFESMSKEMFIDLIYRMCMRLELHELDEHFKVNNTCYKEPHPERIKFKRHA